MLFCCHEHFSASSVAEIGVALGETGIDLVMVPAARWNTIKFFGEFFLGLIVKD